VARPICSDTSAKGLVEGGESCKTDPGMHYLGCSKSAPPRLPPRCAHTCGGARGGVCAPNIDPFTSRVREKRDVMVGLACRFAAQRASLGESPRDRGACLLAAEAWVYDPDDKHRKAAQEIGTHKRQQRSAERGSRSLAGWSAAGCLRRSRAYLFRVPTYHDRPRRPYRCPVERREAAKGRPSRLQACIADGI